MRTQDFNTKLSAQDRYARQVVSYLDASAEGLPHDISERLRVARLHALNKYQEVRVRKTAPVLLGGGVAALGGGEDDRGVLPRLVSLVPLMALIAGLIAIQVFGSDQIAQDLAEIDAAILTDDLPPDAYADPGFAQFLKSRLDQVQQD